MGIFNAKFPVQQNNLYNLQRRRNSHEKTRLIPIFLAFSMMAGTSVASALGISNEYRQTTWLTSNNSVIHLKDSEPDGQFPAVNYLYDGGLAQDGLANKSGYGTTVERNVGDRITALQPCISQTFPWPAKCGKWRSK
ncbi:hypothetical protein ACTOVN_06070 [Arcanobacterium canis]